MLTHPRKNNISCNKTFTQWLLNKYATKSSFVIIFHFQFQQSIKINANLHLIEWRGFMFSLLYFWWKKQKYKIFAKENMWKFFKEIFQAAFKQWGSAQTSTPFQNIQNINQASTSRSAQIENYYIFYLVDYCAIMLLYRFPLFAAKLFLFWPGFFSSLFVHNAFKTTKTTWAQIIMIICCGCGSGCLYGCTIFFI